MRKEELRLTIPTPEFPNWPGGAFVSAQSCLTLCSPMDCSPPGSSVHGISRQEYRVAISSSRGSSQPKDQIHVSCVSCIGRSTLYHCATWEGGDDWTREYGKSRLGRKMLSVCSRYRWYYEWGNCLWDAVFNGEKVCIELGAAHRGKAAETICGWVDGWRGSQGIINS